MLTRTQRLIALWGIACVVLLLGRAVMRLMPFAVEAWTHGSMTLVQEVVFVVWVAFNAYTEGYRAFQLRFCPRVVGRAIKLAQQPSVLKVIFALPYVMSLFGDKKRQTLMSWGMVGLIICFVVIVRMMPQPWRGIVDAGVVVGLIWGIIVLIPDMISIARHGTTPPDAAIDSQNPPAYERDASAAV